MNEYLREKLRRVLQEADLLIERAAELVTETMEVNGAGGSRRKDS
jgi:hypothetical protein